MSSVQVKQFRTPSGARSEAFLSYCLFDGVTREAMFVDPHFEALTEYAEFLNTHRLKLVWVVETQAHFSHPTAAHALSKQFKAVVAMSESTQSLLAEKKLRSNDTLALGDIKIIALLTPGIRPDSLCLRAPEMIFTGEMLWAGATSGFGLPDADCGELFESLQFLKTNVATDDFVFPGYDVQGLSFSRWGVELEKNPDLLAKQVDDLKTLKARVGVRLADDFIAFSKFNSDKNPAGFGFRKSENFFHTENIQIERPNYSTISSDKFSQKTEALIDVRDPDEFERGHIPGSKNIPLSELAFHLEEFEKLPRIYLSCQSGKRSAFAANTLSYLGMKNVIMLSGGFQAWQNAGLPTKK